MPRPKKQQYKLQKDGYYHCEYLGHHLKARTVDELQEKKEAYKKMLEGRAVRQSTQTLSDYMAYWLPIHKAGVKASTYNTYVSILNAVAEPIGSIRLSSLTSDNIAEAYASLKGKSASYIHKSRILLTQILDSATDAGYLKANPARAKSITPPKGPSGTHRAITKYERSLIEKVPHRMQLAAMIMLCCGLRRGEVLGLRAEDINGDSLTVRRAVFFVGNRPEVSEPKTANSIRTVPAPEIILRLMPKMNRDCYILTGTREPMTEQAFIRCWESYMDTLSREANGGIYRRWWGRTKEHRAILAAGGNIPPYQEVLFRPHDLRHTYCTMLRDAGVDIHQAIIWMGHADEKMILRIYDHPGTERETEAKKLLFDALTLRNALPS